MIKYVPEAIIIALVISGASTVYWISQILSDLSKGSEFAVKYSWVVHITLNVVGYSTVFIPGYLVYRYVRKIKYVEKTGSGCMPSTIYLCFGSSELDLECGNTIEKGGIKSQNAHSSMMRDGIKLIMCFLGLQSSYLIWGLLQEKVMTQKYVDSTGAESYFADSQFLVFVNRILAFIMAGLYIMCTPQPTYKMPAYKYVFCSFSNIMSSWCQYEALKYVSFPTQVLAKASKVIPVMVMGKIVSKNKYECYEYCTAVLMSAGMILFMLEASENSKVNTVTTFSGITLLVMYIVFDSFTSNWQSALFKQHGMSSVQMMYGVNMYSCLFTAMSLVQQGELMASIEFMLQFPKFTLDCIFLSIFSAAGQLMIFYTIATFGPVTFVIIMTIRQGLAILLSCIIYKHYLSSLGIFGVLIVFISVFLRIYFNQRHKVSSRMKM